MPAVNTYVDVSLKTKLEWGEVNVDLVVILYETSSWQEQSLVDNKENATPARTRWRQAHQWGKSWELHDDIVLDICERGVRYRIKEKKKIDFFLQQVKVKYKVVKKLGSGGFASVFLVSDQVTSFARHSRHMPWKEGWAILCGKVSKESG